MYIDRAGFSKRGAGDIRTIKAPLFGQPGTTEAGGAASMIGGAQ